MTLHASDNYTTSFAHKLRETKTQSADAYGHTDILTQTQSIQNMSRKLKRFVIMFEDVNN